MSVVGIGLAGLGIHGSRYARHLLSGDVPGARLAAVARRDEHEGRAFALAHGIAYVRDPQDLAAVPGVDAVVAALPGALHPGVVLACIDRAVPVLVEKPLAPDAASAAAIVGRVARAGVPVMVAHTLRFDGVVRRLREEAARLGRIDAVAIDQHFEPNGRPWLDDPASGGVLRNTAVHGFDLLRYLTGLEPLEVSCQASRRGTARTEDLAFVIVRLGDRGVLGSVRNARTSAARSGRIEIVAERGILEGDHVHRTLRRIVGRDVADLGPVPASPTLPATLGAFVACVADGQPPPVTAQDGAIAVRCVEAAQTSAATGRVVRLEEVRS